MATRNSSKSAIPITNPNAKLSLPENVPTNGGSVISPSKSDGDSGKDDPAPDHRSATAAPVLPSPRPSASKKTESTWTTLDMGGIRLKNLAPSLFGFTYLTTLYLNHNSLTAIPPAIARLRNLVLLDLSGNELTSVPPEFGMLTSLRELYLFDNHITTLPHELGTLHQLELIGIEGNPLDNSLRSIVQKDGTAALIAFLRDSCPVPAPPPERIWRSLDRAPEDPNAETFTVLSYNILCERSATAQLYGYTPSWALAWGYRKELILTEILNYDADILCLQVCSFSNLI